MTLGQAERRQQPCAVRDLRESLKDDAALGLRLGDERQRTRAAGRRGEADLVGLPSEGGRQFPLGEGPRRSEGGDSTVRNRGFSLQARLSTPADLQP